MSLFGKVQTAYHDISSEIKTKLNFDNVFHTHTHGTAECSEGTHGQRLHRFQSFAPERTGNSAKWFVDGASYFHAVSVALENARDTIWILDWWLSPELYLRRPPAKNEQYRIDRMLQAAAERGVKINVIVYREVTQALTLSSYHTKHALEALHENISVFRHPDHLPDRQTLESSFVSSLQGMKLTAASASKMPHDALKAIYGATEETVLYWAHHEKLLLVDGQIGFMGGLDACYGRWDSNQHSIADVHPGNVEDIIFPGQDYNNARVLDFQEVAHFQENKLDRTKSSRMGWSDVALSLSGPVVQDLRSHFAQRWDFIYGEKYDVRKDPRYQPLDHHLTNVDAVGHAAHDQQATPGDGNIPPQHHHLRERMRERFEEGYGRVADQTEQFREAFGTGRTSGGLPGQVPCQIMRSCAKWSHGGELEHSIANAYIEVIRRSERFVYIENQFFITATSDEQKPIKNKIAAAIVDRIIRAARSNQPYKVIVNIPAVPAFAGDLRSDDSLSTRAIMEFQYNSINRGGHSIYESLAREGIDPTRYIRFYNLRNYDRMNADKTLQQAEQRTGVSYDQARQGYDRRYGAANGQQPGEAPGQYNKGSEQEESFKQYNAIARTLGHDSADKRWDTVAECYMLNGRDIRSVPWTNPTENEMDYFVSEELYIHSKLLIADDRVVICGSANLNDRSQLGSHDSEIAICIQEDPTMRSTMAGDEYLVSPFAASLRRQLFRKHIGLLKPQDFTRPDENFFPVDNGPNIYDWGSREDQLVADPLSGDFDNLWNSTARTNTAAFEQVFHPVPTDRVRNWKEYDEYFERFFSTTEEVKEAKKDGKDKTKGADEKKPSTWKWGHVVAEEFASGPEGVRQVKEVLSRIRGNLVEMPLLFLKDEDIAKQGLSLNSFTEEVYT